MHQRNILNSFLVLIIVGIQGSMCQQKFEQQPSYTEVNPGQDALLVCRVQNKRGTCSWQKDNKPVGMYLHKYEWADSQENGECSIWIKSAKLEFDDGIWECQVTASNFHTQDALTSIPARLVVRVPPQRPKIEFNTTQILPGQNLTVLQGEIATVKCISNYGNPPPLLKWMLDLDEIIPFRKQTNTTELDNPRTWMATSILELAITKESHGKSLKCIAVHDSYTSKSSSVEVRLNVMFVPETRLIGIPTSDVEELKDTVAVRCEVNANPRANVIWKKEGLSQPVSLQELLKFSPVARQNSGLYTCHARNAAGESTPQRFHLSVKYPPKILSIGPDRLTTATLYTSVSFECIAEGNPLPTYQWLQRLTTRHNYVREQGRESKLQIPNVTYEHQGEYVCKALNIIGGSEREVQSEAVVLQVVGAPQILKHFFHENIEIEEGETANLTLVICSDPRPKFVAWEWGSLRLEAGSQTGKYKADEVTQDSREDCYISVLHIENADGTDSRSYYMTVENDRGKDRHSMKLVVNEPVRASTLLILGSGISAAILVLICVCLYALRNKNFCITSESGFKETNLDSQRLATEKKTLPSEVIPSDAIYTARRESEPVGVNVSPETLKPIATLRRQTFPEKRNENQVVECNMNIGLEENYNSGFEPCEKHITEINIDEVLRESKKNLVYGKTMTVRPSRSQLRVNGIQGSNTRARNSTWRPSPIVYD